MQAHTSVEIWLITKGQHMGASDTFTYLTKRHGLPMVPLNRDDTIIFAGKQYRHARTEWEITTDWSTVRYYVYPDGG